MLSASQQLVSLCATWWRWRYTSKMFTDIYNWINYKLYYLATNLRWFWRKYLFIGYIVTQWENYIIQVYFLLHQLCTNIGISQGIIKSIVDLTVFPFFLTESIEINVKEEILISTTNYNFTPHFSPFTLLASKMTELIRSRMICHPHSSFKLNS